jgi:hypothetical protein
MSSGTKKKKGRYLFYIFLKIPIERAPSWFTNRAPMKGAALYRDFFYRTLKFVINVSLNNEFSVLTKALEELCLSMLP